MSFWLRLFGSEHSLGWRVMPFFGLLEASVHTYTNGERRQSKNRQINARIKCRAAAAVDDGGGVDAYRDTECECWVDSHM